MPPKNSAPKKAGPGTPRSKKREKTPPVRKDSPRGPKESSSRPPVAPTDVPTSAKEERVRGGGNLREALTSTETPPIAAFPACITESAQESLNQEHPYRDIVHSLHPLLTSAPLNPRNNIMLMTDGYKFSHHKQYPVSWMPEHARPVANATEPYRPPILIAPRNGRPGSKILKILPVPCFVEDPTRQLKVSHSPLPRHMLLIFSGKTSMHDTVLANPPSPLQSCHSSRC